MDIHEEPLTVDDMAAYLRLAPYTVREHAKAGLIPGHKQGGRWRFFLSEYHAYRTAKVVDPWVR